MKRIATVLAVAALAVGAVACSSSGDASDDPTATTTAMVPSESPATDGGSGPSSTIPSSSTVTPGTAEGGAGGSSGGTGTGSGSGAGSGTDGAPLEIRAAASSLGQVVVDADGRTLYVYVGAGTTTCPAGCEAQWPPLVGTVVAGPGITAPLGTQALASGTQQVTLAGRPLYYYAGDTDPGASSGQGVGGTWFVVNGAGEPATN